MRTNTKNIAKNKKRAENEGDKNEHAKKPFDKKKYRLKKYSNKYKSMYNLTPMLHIG